MFQGRLDVFFIGYEFKKIHGISQWGRSGDEICVIFTGLYLDVVAYIHRIYDVISRTDLQDFATATRANIAY